MGSTVLFFMYFLLLIVDGVFDLAFVYYFIAIILVIVDAFLFHGKNIVLANPFSCGKLPGLWSVFLFYNFLVTFICTIAYMSSYSNYGIKFIINPVFIFLIVLYFSRYLDWKLFFNIMRKFGVIIGIIGAIETYTKQALFPTLEQWSRKMESRNGTELFRSYTIFAHPIVNGMFLLLLIISFYFFPIRRKIYNYLVIGILFYCVLGTGSRSSWVSLIVILLLIMRDALKRINKKVSNVHMINKIYASAMIFAVAYIFKDTYMPIVTKAYVRLKTVFYLNSSDLSRTHRYGMAKMVIEYLKKDFFCLIFGKGAYYGLQFEKEHPLRDAWTIIDNQYLTFVLCFGLIGLFIFIMSFLIPFLISDKSNNNNLKLPSYELLLIALELFFFEGYQWKICNFLYICMLFAFSYYKRINDLKTI